MMKKGQRVLTEDGAGTIVQIEEDGEIVPALSPGYHFIRYGVKHDVFPSNKPRMYPNDILFYHETRLKGIY